MRRKNHHLSDEVYDYQPSVVSVTVCTAARKRVFEDPSSAECVRDAICRRHADNSRVLAYCVMPDHVHVVVLLSGRPPAKFVQALKAVTSREMKRRGYTDRLWQRDYYDHIVRRGEGIFKTIRYVLLNPVRKGFVGEWRDWPYSGSIEWPEIDDSILDDRTIENILWSEVTFE